MGPIVSGVGVLRVQGLLPGRYPSISDIPHRGIRCLRSSARLIPEAFLSSRVPISFVRGLDSSLGLDSPYHKMGLAEGFGEPEFPARFQDQLHTGFQVDAVAWRDEDRFDPSPRPDYGTDDSTPQR